MSKYEPTIQEMAEKDAKLIILEFLKTEYVNNLGGSWYAWKKIVDGNSRTIYPKEPTKDYSDHLKDEMAKLIISLI